MAIFDFMTKFGDLLSWNGTVLGSPSVWIVDDLIIVTSRAQCEKVAKYITTEGPKYGHQQSHGKLEACSPYITADHPLALKLAENGFVDTLAGAPPVSSDGLCQLLDASLSLYPLSDRGGQCCFIVPQ